MSDSSTIFRLIHLDFNYTKLALTLELGNVFLIGFLALIIVLLLFQWHKTPFNLVEMGIEISGSPKAVFKVKRDYTNLYIANRIYIELVTRKVALPFQEGKDVLVEVYDSWYQLFVLVREEMKTIPGHLLQAKHSGASLVKLTTKILNEGLRPHLTTYQADFRKWYQEELKKTSSKALSPQEIQMKYPCYEELVVDIKKANQVIIDYSILLKQFIEGK